MLFESFSKGPGGFPYVFIITGKITKLEPMVLLPLKWVCIPYLPQTFFNAVAETMDVWYDYVTLGFNFIGSGLGTCGTLSVSPITDITGGPGTSFSTLSKAHLGYLQLVRAFLRFSISFWRSSGLLQTVLALWVRVIMTLYFAER